MHSGKKRGVITRLPLDANGARGCIAWPRPLQGRISRGQYPGAPPRGSSLDGRALPSHGRGDGSSPSSSTRWFPSSVAERATVYRDTGVRFPWGPPNGSIAQMAQSARLISERSEVRCLLLPPFFGSIGHQLSRRLLKAEKRGQHPLEPLTRARPSARTLRFQRRKVGAAPTRETKGR